MILGTKFQPIDEIVALSFIDIGVWLDGVNSTTKSPETLKALPPAATYLISGERHAGRHPIGDPVLLLHDFCFVESIRHVGRKRSSAH